jgi:hypothetical protein
MEAMVGADPCVRPISWAHTRVRPYRKLYYTWNALIVRSPLLTAHRSLLTAPILAAFFLSFR